MGKIFQKKKKKEAIITAGTNPRISVLERKSFWEPTMFRVLAEKGVEWKQMRRKKRSTNLSVSSGCANTREMRAAITDSFREPSDESIVLAGHSDRLQITFFFQVF
jgi:hypothetical protein